MYEIVISYVDSFIGGSFHKSDTKDYRDEYLTQAIDPSNLSRMNAWNRMSHAKISHVGMDHFICVIRLTTRYVYLTQAIDPSNLSHMNAWNLMSISRVICVIWGGYD